MAATLALVFRSRLRLLPLGLALAAAAMTFGALSLAGGSLTMASIAALPVLIGLAVDYAIQFQARFDEAEARGEPEPAVAAVVAGGPTILTAGLATATGFLVLLLSPVPMVRGFGLLLVLGIVLALGCALCAGFAALTRFRRAAGRRSARRRGSRRVRRRCARHPRVHGGRRVAGGPLLAGARPGAVAAAARAGDRACGGGGRPRARHAERGGVGRSRAGAPGPPGAARRERAPGGDRRVRRDRRDRARRRHHRPGGDRLDDALPEPGAARARLPPGQALHAEAGRARAVPGAVAPRPLQHGRPGPGGPPARRGAGLLLAGSGHRRPDDGQPRLRHQADAARPPEAGGRRHQGGSAAARRGGGVRGRACRCWRRRPTARSPRRGAAGSRCSPRSRACSSCCSPRAARPARPPSR